MKGRFFYIAFLIAAFSFGQGGFYKASYQQANSDPYVAEGADAYFNAKDLGLADGASVGSMTDSKNSITMSQSPGAPTFDNTSGFDQVIFDGVDDGFKMDSDYQTIDWDPDTDSYCLIVHFGDVTIDNFLSYAFHKGPADTNAQFWLRTNSSGSNMNGRVGGLSENLSGLRTDLPNGFFVMRRDGATTEFYFNDVLIASEAGGNAQATNPWTFGVQSNTNANHQTMSFRKIAFFSPAPSLAWLTERFNNRESE